MATLVVSAAVRLAGVSHAPTALHLRHLTSLFALSLVGFFAIIQGEDIEESVASTPVSCG
ncbi:MAG: hypothetical protein IPK67_14345 [Planctomycetes bacterium]|nr:hypothetical protein [Planctomycetota bacterium]